MCSGWTFRPEHITTAALIAVTAGCAVALTYLVACLTR